jgi:hypothetical protein
MYKPGYRVGGNGAKDGICAAQVDARDPYMCADEGEAVAGQMAKYRASSPDCIFSDERYEGAYGSPYVSVTDSGGYGVVYHSMPTAAQSRYYKYSIWCPGWGRLEPSPRELQLKKRRTSSAL